MPGGLSLRLGNPKERLSIPPVSRKSWKNAGWLERWNCPLRTDSASLKSLESFKQLTSFCSSWILAASSRIVSRSAINLLLENPSNVDPWNRDVLFFCDTKGFLGDTKRCSWLFPRSKGSQSIVKLFLTFGRSKAARVGFDGRRPQSSSSSSSSGNKAAQSKSSTNNRKKKTAKTTATGVAQTTGKAAQTF